MVDPAVQSTVEALQGSLVDVGHPRTGPRKPSDPQEVRYKLAVLVTVAYILMLSAPIVMVWTGVLTEANGVDFLKTIAAVFGGPVGAVIGFYFSATTR